LDSGKIRSRGAPARYIHIPFDPVHYPAPYEKYCCVASRAPPAVQCPAVPILQPDSRHRIRVQVHQ
ncbi:MAG TPA: hypothetical protein VD772_12400, partial [Anseongella sp.]|nr:hypothetical protein [Anseongella sp.]